MISTQNFTLAELACKDGTPVPYALRPLAIKLLLQLETIRSIWDKPIIITSGFRTWSHNKAVDGSPISFHLLCMAVDFKVQGVEPREVYAAVLHLMQAGEIEKGGIGEYDTFIHYDIRGYITSWH
jgi:uncharacterized protein YcbK (DUF882 family)